MKLTFSFNVTTLIQTGVLTLSLWFGSQLSMEAGLRERSGSVVGPRGHSTHFQQQRERGRGFANRLTNWQNRRGEGSRQINRNWDRQAGTASKQRTTRLANGKESTAVTNRQRNEDGTVSGHAQRTGFNGKQGVRDWTTTRTDKGRNTSGTYSTRNGGSGTFNTDVTKTESGVTKTKTVTNQDGESVTKSKTIDLEKKE